MLASSKLSEREQRLAQAANERGGKFVIREIAEATGERLQYVTEVAQKWQVLGYLSEVKTNERGHKLGREVMPELAVALRNLGTSESG